MKADDAISLFPYNPYDIQKEFVQEFANILNKNTNGCASIGILESPTGTGKTTSLLCSSISWLINDEIDENRHQGSINVNNNNLSPNEPEWIKQARLQMTIKNQSSSIDNPPTQKFHRPKKRLKTIDESIQKILELFNNEEGGDGDKINRPTKRVYYCSRTHSQLAQVMGEFEKIAKSNFEKLGNRIHALTLGSRKNCCINSQARRGVKSTEALNEKCQELLGDDKCPYYNQDKEADIKEFVNKVREKKIVDIEELIKMGKGTNCCPYYGSREASKYSNFITVPYNLILNKTSRDAFDIDLRDSIVIFDEAHNLVDFINSMNSCQVLQSELSFIFHALQRYIDLFEGRFNPENLSLLRQLHYCVIQLNKFLNEKVTGIFSINKFLSDCLMENINMIKIVDYVQSAHLSPKLASYHDDNENENGNTDIDVDRPSTTNANALNNLSFLLKSLISADKDGRILVINQNEQFIIKYIALNPSEVMREISLEAKSIILAGGTMKPVDDVVTQLFDNQSLISTFSCNHIVPSENVVGVIFNEGPTGLPFKFVHSKRDDLSMLNELSQTINNLCNVIPDGIVCFFPSYQFMDHFRTSIALNSIKELERRKRVFFESPQQVRGNEDILRSYNQAINLGAGAILFAVMGGRLSEGVNFNDKLARAVIVVGQPYPNLSDPETKERSEYFGRLKGDIEASNQYLENVCMRNVNQTIGRAIRHSNDFAAIIFIDQRYNQGRIISKLPSWIQNSLCLGSSSTFSQSFSQIVKFFRRKKGCP